MTPWKETASQPTYTKDVGIKTGAARDKPEQRLSWMVALQRAIPLALHSEDLLGALAALPEGDALYLIEAAAKERSSLNETSAVKLLKAAVSHGVVAKPLMNSERCDRPKSAHCSRNSRRPLRRSADIAASQAIRPVSASTARCSAVRTFRPVAALRDNLTPCSAVPVSAPASTPTPAAAAAAVPPATAEAAQSSTDALNTANSTDPGASAAAVAVAASADNNIAASAAAPQSDTNLRLSSGGRSTAAIADSDGSRRAFVVYPAERHWRKQYLRDIRALRDEHSAGGEKGRSGAAPPDPCTVASAAAHREIATMARWGERHDVKSVQREQAAWHPRVAASTASTQPPPRWTCRGMLEVSVGWLKSSSFSLFPGAQRKQSASTGESSSNEEAPTATAAPAEPRVQLVVGEQAIDVQVGPADERHVFIFPVDLTGKDVSSHNVTFEGLMGEKSFGMATCDICRLSETVADYVFPLQPKDSPLPPFRPAEIQVRMCFIPERPPPVMIIADSATATCYKSGQHRPRQEAVGDRNKNALGQPGIRQALAYGSLFAAAGGDKVDPENPSELQTKLDEELRWKYLDARMPELAACRALKETRCEKAEESRRLLKVAAKAPCVVQREMTKDKLMDREASKPTSEKLERPVKATRPVLVIPPTARVDGSIVRKVWTYAKDALTDGTQAASMFKKYSRGHSRTMDLSEFRRMIRGGLRIMTEEVSDDEVGIVWSSLGADEMNPLRQDEWLRYLQDGHAAEGQLEVTADELQARKLLVQRFGDFESKLMRAPPSPKPPKQARPTYFVRRRGPKTGRQVSLQASFKASLVLTTLAIKARNSKR